MQNFILFYRRSQFLCYLELLAIATLNVLVFSAQTILLNIAQYFRLRQYCSIWLRQGTTLMVIITATMYFPESGYKPD